MRQGWRPFGYVQRRSYLLAATAGLPLAGCTDDDGTETPTERGDGVKANALRDAVESEGHAVRDLSVDERVDLAYTPWEPTEEGVRESIDDVARAFFDRAYDGQWGVSGLDAAARIDGEVVATWRMEQSWIDAYLDGEMSREELAARVEDSVERRD